MSTSRWSPSDDLKDYNVPFDGVTGSSLARDRLRFLKRELRENLGVNKRYIRAGVREFIPDLQPTIDRIPKGSTLIIMPSTTGHNRIPAMLGDAIKKLRPDVELVNLRGRMITVDHDTPSKIKNKIIDRLDDHRGFAINPKLLELRGQLNRSSLILDDSISTGDSAVTLHRQLLKEGIHAKGIVAAVSGGKYHVRHSDIERLYDKIKDARPSNYPAEQLKQDMYTAFAGYPAAKVKRAELGLARDKDNQIYKRPDLLVHVVKHTAAYLKQERLGPRDMQEMRQSIDPRARQEKQESKPANKLKL